MQCRRGRGDRENSPSQNFRRREIFFQKYEIYQWDWKSLTFVEFGSKIEVVSAQNVLIMS